MLTEKGREKLGVEKLVGVPTLEKITAEMPTMIEHTVRDGKWLIFVNSVDPKDGKTPQRQVRYLLETDEVKCIETVF
jgi:hypothetical protein